MTGEETSGPKTDDLLRYLDVATKFRNHEFNIQILRNALFTGSHAVLLACYAGTITNHPPFAALVVAVFGVALSILWWLYYRASLYWARYWEDHCKQINDKLVPLLNAGVDLFAGQPAGQKSKTPLPVAWYGGKPITHWSVHWCLRAVQVACCVLWLVLSIWAATRVWSSCASHRPTQRPPAAEKEIAPSR